MRTVCLCGLLTLLSCFTCTAAGAADAGDDLDRFLSSRGLLDQPAQVPSTPAATDAPPPARATGGGDRSSELVVAAMGSLGVPYRRGGNTFDSGYDCSGFVRAMVEQNMGQMLPRQAAQQAAATHEIARTELAPGDLVFFNTQNRSFSHVGIYVGDHKFIHSPKSGAVVRIEDMRVNYWNRRFDGARRILAQAVAATAGQSNASGGSLASLPSY
jgi:cell wall-associated NlpC family hydrolase